jgi:hypothetical protein
VADVERISYASASVKINVALAELPSFRALPGTEAGPQHRGTIHICPDPDYIERAFDDAKYGRPSTEPVLECTIPSAVDSTVAPPGRHLMSMFVQYAPYDLRDGSWDEQREAFADRCFDLLNDYAPNFTDAILDRQVLAPLDLERVFNLTGGNIFQGAMTPGQLFAFRPVPGYASYSTPLRGLYLCGAAAHPGGGVMGTPGLNAAREILRQRRLRRIPAWFAGLPRPRRARDRAELGRHLGGDPALVHAEAPLAERGTHPDVEPEPSRERLRRLERPAEVARPELADRLGSESLGERLRLLAARGRERRVAVALDAAVAIPLGLPVTDEVELRHGSRTLPLDM